jgi:hypothetical protein
MFLPCRESKKSASKVRSFPKKVLLILGIYSEAIVEDAEDEEDGEEFHSATTRLQPDESGSELVNQGDENVRMLASNLLEKIADGKLDVVAGTEQLFLMMRTAKYDEQIRRLESVTIIPIEIGVGNQLLKIILDWIDMRIENIGEEELDAREEYYETLLEYEARDDRWKAWKSLKGPEFATLRLERKTLNGWAGARQENSQEFIPSLADRNDIKIQSKELTATISPLVKELKDLNSARQVHGQLLQAQ